MFTSCGPQNIQTRQPRQMYGPYGISVNRPSLVFDRATAERPTTEPKTDERISVTSTDGEGTAVTVTLPCTLTLPETVQPE